MGGGLSLTFPGYHIFTSGIILMTGLPEYVAQAVVVSLFSSLIVLAAFLITKRVWSEPAAYIVAFLVAVSRFDIEMFLWGGYPNVITLVLIPVIFYLYLKKDRFSITPFLVSTSILAGSIFLTHSLSAAIYVAVTMLIVLFVLIKPEFFSTTRKNALYWLLPIVFGIILFSPFIFQAIPAYLNSSASLSADQTSSDAIKLATVVTRTLPLELVLPLFGVIAGFVVFSKKYFGRFIALPTFLLSIWFFVPLVLTQSYLIGFAIDYNRFLYFSILPLIIFVAVILEHGSSFFANIIITYQTFSNQTQKIKIIAIKKISRVSTILTHKNIYSGFILFFVVFSFVALPIFMGPIYNSGQSIQKFYQTMNSEGWEAIEWAKTNTPIDAVFVSDALYGWWFGGFAQRRTYSAVDPQYLTINEEYNKALFARNVLDTDFLVDNGLVQVREDGGYLARHNPEILATLNWTYFPYSFFNFDSQNTQIRYRVNGNLQSVTLDKLEVKEMRIEKTVANYNQNLILDATIIITRGNDYLKTTQLTSIQRGLRLVNLTTTIESTVSGVSLDWVDIIVESKGKRIPFNDYSTVGLIDEGVKALGQLIFTTKPYSIPEVCDETTTTVKLQYCLNSESHGQIQIYAGAYSVTDDLQIYNDELQKRNFLSSQMRLNLNPNPTPTETDFEQVFDYRSEMQNYNVSYIACRTPEMLPKFLRDPIFSLVFINKPESSKVINNEIAIFKVNGNLK